MMAEPSADSLEIVIRIRRPPFVAILALVQLLVALLSSPIATGSGEWSELVGMGVLYTQPFLFAEWLVLGFGRFANRLQWTLFTFAILLLVPSAFSSDSPLDLSDLFIRVTYFVAGIALTSAAQRWAGWHVARESEPTDFEKSLVGFSIRSLLGWTAAWATYLAVVRLLLPESQWEIRDWDDILIGLILISLILAPLALGGLALLSATWINRLTITALVVWILSSIAAAIYLAILEGTNFFQMALLTFGGMLSVCLAVIPLRLAGYRLLKRQPQGSQAAAGNV